MQTSMTRQEIINLSIYEIESKQIFEHRILDGRIKQKTREEFSQYVKTHDNEANLLMKLGFDFHD